MKVVLARIDERLVHGQVIASWTKQLQIKRILIVDDSLAKDSFMSDVMAMAAPTGVRVEVLSAENALAKDKEDTSDENTMLLFKNVAGAYALINAGFKIDRLDIGNIGSGPTRKPITKRVFMSSEEISKIKELCNMGIYIYLQMLHSDPEIDVKKLI